MIPLWLPPFRLPAFCLDLGVVAARLPALLAAGLAQVLVRVRVLVRVLGPVRLPEVAPLAVVAAPKPPPRLPRQSRETGVLYLLVVNPAGLLLDQLLLR